MDTYEYYSFENYVINETNKLAAKACRSFAEGGDGRDWDVNQLLIYGDVGVGKTHLVSAVVNRIIRINPELNVRYVTGESFANEIIGAISSGSSMSNLRKEYRELDVFVLDDIEYINKMNAVRSELYHIIDELLLRGRRVIVASNISPNDLFKDFLELKNRLDGFCTIGIAPPDEDLITEIVDRMLKELKLEDIDDDVKDYVMECADGKINKVKGMLRTIKLYVDIEEDSDPWIQDVRKLLEKTM